MSRSAVGSQPVGWLFADSDLNGAPPAWLAGGRGCLIFTYQLRLPLSTRVNVNYSLSIYIEVLYINCNKARHSTTQPDDCLARTLRTKSKARCVVRSIYMVSDAKVLKQRKEHKQRIFKYLCQVHCSNHSWNPSGRGYYDVLLDLASPTALWSSCTHSVVAPYLWFFRMSRSACFYSENSCHRIPQYSNGCTGLIWIYSRSASIQTLILLWLLLISLLLPSTTITWINSNLATRHCTTQNIAQSDTPCCMPCTYNPIKLI